MKFTGIFALALLSSAVSAAALVVEREAINRPPCPGCADYKREASVEVAKPAVAIVVRAKQCPGCADGSTGPTKREIEEVAQVKPRAEPKICVGCADFKREAEVEAKVEAKIEERGTLCPGCADYKAAAPVVVEVEANNVPTCPGCADPLKLVRRSRIVKKDNAPTQLRHTMKRTIGDAAPLKAIREIHIETCPGCAAHGS